MLLLQQLQQAGMVLLQQQAGMLLLHQAGMLLVAENSPSVLVRSSQGRFFFCQKIVFFWIVCSKIGETKVEI